MQELRKTYNYRVNVPSFAIVSCYPSPGDKTQLVQDWLSLIKQYPKSYLTHRFHLFTVMLGMRKEPVYYPFHLGIDENEFGFKFTTMTDKQLGKRLKKFRKYSTYTIYRPWIYCLLSIMVVSFYFIQLMKRRILAVEDYLSVTVSLSGLATVSSLFVIATAADYRYITWMILAALFSAAIPAVKLLKEVRSSHLTWYKSLNIVALRKT